jgi:hypothetical protein
VGHAGLRAASSASHNFTIYQSVGLIGESCAGAFIVARAGTSEDAFASGGKNSGTGSES